MARTKLAHKTILGKRKLPPMEILKNKLAIRGRVVQENKMFGDSIFTSEREWEAGKRILICMLTYHVRIQKGKAAMAVLTHLATSYRHDRMTLVNRAAFVRPFFKNMMKHLHFYQKYHGGIPSPYVGYLPPAKSIYLFWLDCVKTVNAVESPIRFWDPDHEYKVVLAMESGFPRGPDDVSLPFMVRVE